MALIRLEWHEHPAPPNHEMRQKRILDSGGSVVGTVANLYIDEDSRQLRFLDVLTSGFLGLERKHHLVPVEAVSEEDPGSITLGVDRETVESAPPFPGPHVVPDEEYQRTLRGHYGYMLDKTRSSENVFLVLGSIGYEEDHCGCRRCWPGYALPAFAPPREGV